MEKNTAKLTVEHSGKFGMIYFQQGQVVHAEFEPDVGEKALFRMLVLDDGKFRVENGVRSPTITITANWNNLLLEGLHQMDAQQDSNESANLQLLGMLMNVKGVQRAAVISREGEVITSNFKAEEEFTLAALAELQVGVIGELLGRSNPIVTSIIVAQNRILVARFEDKIVFIEVEAKHQLDTVLPFIKQALNQ